MMTRKNSNSNGSRPGSAGANETGQGRFRPRPAMTRDGWIGRGAYSPTGVNVPAFALNRALWNSRLSRAMNFTSIPFGHAAWHS